MNKTNFFLNVRVYFLFCVKWTSVVVNLPNRGIFSLKVVYFMCYDVFVFINVSVTLPCVSPAGLLESSMRLKPHEAQSFRKKALWVSWASIVATIVLAVAAFSEFLWRGRGWFVTPCRDKHSHVCSTRSLPFKIKLQNMKLSVNSCWNWISRSGETSLRNGPQMFWLHYLISVRSHD